MRTLDIALEDVVTQYKALTYEVEQLSPTQWILTVWNERVPGSYLKIELHDVGGVPAALVMERHNVGRRSMTRFMDRFMDALED